MTNQGEPVHVDRPAASAPAQEGRALRLESVLRDLRAGSGSGWATGKASVLDQAYEEYCQRLEAGAPLDPEEFCARYSRYRTSLRRLIDVHRCIEENLPPNAGSVPLRWPEPGDSFLGFTLQWELGRGAFARVFLATEPAIGNRLVAVKISLGGAAEAETLGRLDHPNVVPVYSVQKEDLSGLSLVCMPYLGGATLCDVLDRAFAQPGVPARARLILEVAQDAVPPDQPVTARSAPSPWLQCGTYIDGVVHLGAQLADALSFVHARGICHRDLKPSNVLLTPDGTPMLLDFNLAFDMHRANQRLGGTLPYMAPEQLRAAGPDIDLPSSAVDERSDLFSLGVMLYELLSGTHPFGPIPLNPSSQLVRAQLLERQQRGARPLRQANPRVDRPLARIIDSCLNFVPADRPQSAGDVVAALRGRLLRKRRARRLGIMLGVAVLILLTGVAGSYLFREQGLLEQGLESYQQGHYDKAVLSLDRVLKVDPENIGALRARGRAWQRLGKLDLAHGDYARADRLRPDGQTKVCIGYCLSRQAQHYPAIRYYQEALHTGFAPPAVFNNLGYSYLQLDRLPEANKELTQAIRLDPALQPAFHNRAVADLQLAGKKTGYIPEAGLEDVERALQLGPATADLYLLAAELHAVAAEHDERLVDSALNHLRKALEQGCDPRLLERDGFLQSLRTHPRFQDLVRQPTPSKPLSKAIRLVDPVDDLPN